TTVTNTSSAAVPGNRPPTPFGQPTESARVRASPMPAWPAMPLASVACAKRRPRRMPHESDESRFILHPLQTTMLFHTWVFLVFFLIVYPVYLLVRRNNQLMNIWLMIASYTFYGWWNPWYLLLLFGTSAIDYLMVLLMERSRRTRTFWLVISLVSNFGFLGYFKYSGF